MKVNNSVLIIAEAGVNHNGCKEKAKQLIEVAAESESDIVKFQTFSADRLVTVSARKADYQLHYTSNSESQYEMIRKLELTQKMHEELRDHCRKCGIEFLSTGFDILSVDMLADLGLQLFQDTIGGDY